MYRIEDKPSLYLLRGKREILSMLSTLENYERENGRFANLRNVLDIKNDINDIIPKIEMEIQNAKRFEVWLEDDVQEGYAVFGKRVSPMEKVTRYRYIKAFKSYKRANEYKEELKLGKEFTEYVIDKIILE
jgi:transcriptional regulator NrdR family protein